jgi:exosortase
VTIAATPTAARRRTDTTAALGLGAAVVALYVPVLRELVAVWLHVTYYSYGFLVPVFSAYLVLDALRDDVRADRGGRMSELHGGGLVMMAAGLAVLGLGVAAGSLALRTLSLPVVLLGVALTTLGPALARRLAFPIGFLVLMTPLPDGVLPALSLPLQQLAAFVAEHALRALGIAVARDELFLKLPSVTLHVTEACNGLRFLLAMLVIGTAFAATTQRRPWRRAAIVAAAVAVALLANLARVTGTGVMAELWGAGAAIGLPHVIWGKVVYVAALVPFIAFVLIMRRRA